MFHIIYMSSAVTPFTKPELRELLKQARENNSRLNVTGILLYKDGNFLQTLEGERETVQALYAKIAKDPRHRGVMDLFSEPIAEREFPDWSMAFRDLEGTDAEVPEGFNELLNANWAETDLSRFSGKLRAFMKLFAH